MSLNLLFANLISVLIFFILYKNKNFITKKFNLIDHPDKNRKLHQTKTPLIGGLLIFVCVVYLIAVDQLFIINTNFILIITNATITISITTITTITTIITSTTSYSYNSNDRP